MGPRSAVRPSVALPLWPRNAVLGGGECMRAPPLGPSVELCMGPRNSVLGGGSACGHRRWSFGGAPIWGYETWFWVGEAHASHATGDFDGAPYGATKHVKDAPK
eukprot:7894749-Pyramimonas_sp.AAC.1